MGLDSKSSDLRRAVELIATDIHAAHTIAQQYESDPLADTIHAIIHRREGDFANSVYWWRRVGLSLAPSIAAVYPSSDPVAFVRAAQSEPGAKLEPVERAELEALRQILRPTSGAQERPS